MSEDSTNSPRDSEAAAEPRPQISLYRKILNAWGDLFRSRESLLLRTYAELFETLTPGAPRPTSLEEARRRFHPVQHQMWESKIVLATRIIAAWVVFWTTLVPAGLITWLCINRIQGAQQRIGLILGYVPIAFLILFPFLSAIGLAIQSVFSRPFIALLSRLLELPVTPDKLR